MNLSLDPELADKWRTRYGGVRWTGAEEGSARVALSSGEGERSRSEGKEALFRPRDWRAALLCALLRRSRVGRGPRPSRGME